MEVTLTFASQVTSPIAHAAERDDSPIQAEFYTL